MSSQLQPSFLIPVKFSMAPSEELRQKLDWNKVVRRNSAKLPWLRALG
jgi:hypothetical protein